MSRNRLSGGHGEKISDINGTREKSTNIAKVHRKRANKRLHKEINFPLLYIF